MKITQYICKQKHQSKRPLVYVLSLLPPKTKFVVLPYRANEYLKRIVSK